MDTVASISNLRLIDLDLAAWAIRAGVSVLGFRVYGLYRDCREHKGMLRANVELRY